ERQEGETVEYGPAELDELQLAYAMSVHKSQGSEYGIVIMPLVRSHYMLLQRNLLYTAITRAKQQVLLVGSGAAMNTAVSNDKTRKRYSLLAERLQDERALC
ncbi:MAG: ATP-binding domain-containing protein, partial [Acidaminococcaceae bacterium]